MTSQPIKDVELDPCDAHLPCELLARSAVGHDGQAQEKFLDGNCCRVLCHGSGALLHGEQLLQSMWLVLGDARDWLVCWCSYLCGGSGGG